MPKRLNRRGFSNWSFWAKLTERRREKVVVPVAKIRKRRPKKKKEGIKKSQKRGDLVIRRMPLIARVIWSSCLCIRILYSS